MVESFKTINKGYEWVLDQPSRVFYATALVYNSIRCLVQVRKDMVKGLVKETSLTKKQAKKIADDSMSSVEDAFDKDEDRFEAYDFYETNLMMIYSIRSNKSYANDVHQYCDNDLELIRWMVNEDDDREEWLTIARQKSLNVMIDKYTNSFDKFGIVSKKYDGIWY